MKSNVCECFLILTRASLAVGKCYRKALEMRLPYVRSVTRDHDSGASGQ